MAITGNQQQESTSGKKYYGIGTFKVIGFNLTLAELEKLGVSYKQEPQYTNIELGGNTFSKVVVYLKNEKFDVIRRVEYLISNEDKKSEKGSYQIINNIGQSTWATSVQECLEKYTWFQDFGTKIAKSGEVDLLNFVLAWVNYKQKDDVKSENYNFISFDDFGKFVKGDVRELNNLIASYGVNDVKVMFYIKGGYEKAYGKIIGKYWKVIEGDKGMAAQIEDATKAYPLDGVVTLKAYMEYSETNTPMDDRDVDISPEEADFPF